MLASFQSGILAGPVILKSLPLWPLCVPSGLGTVAESISIPSETCPVQRNISPAYALTSHDPARMGSSIHRFSRYTRIDTAYAVAST